MWNNPKVIGQCVMLIGGFVMEKLSNNSTILFGGTELDVGSAAAAGSVYILDISILLNTVVCVIYCTVGTFEGLNFCEFTQKFFVNFNFREFHHLAILYFHESKKIVKQ